MTRKIVVIDGQGGKLGALIIAQLINTASGGLQIYAVGTNSTATSVMLKAGAHYAATGENPVIVHARDADVIAGPMGIVIADALLGEISPAMATAVGQSRAHKVLLPTNRCNNTVVGVKDIPFAELIGLAVRQIEMLCHSFSFAEKRKNQRENGTTANG